MDIVKHIVGLFFIVFVSNRIKSWFSLVVRLYSIVPYCSKVRKGV